MENISNDAMQVITENGVLLVLSRKNWQANAAITSELPEQLVRVSGKIINKKCSEYSAIQGILAGVSRDVRRYSHNWLREGFFLVPCAHLDRVIEIITAAQERLSSAVRNLDYVFLSEIDAMRNEYRSNGLEFPENAIPADLRKKFSIDYQLLQFNIPANIPESVYQAETEKLQAEFRQVLENSLASLRIQFNELVSELSEKLATGKQLRASSFNQLHEFIELFDSLNIASDSDLKALVSQSEQLLRQFSVSSLGVRSSAEQFRNHIADLQKNITGLLQNATRNIGDADENWK